MTQKEINQAIYDKIAEIAQGLLERSKFPEGSYTEKQIVESIYTFVASDEDTNNGGVKIEATNFKCEIHPSMIFAYLQNFAVATRCTRKIFVKAASEEGVIYRAKFQMPKGIGKLCNFADKDHPRESMNCVYIDVEKGNMVASDGHILGVLRTDITDEEGSTGYSIYLDAKAARKMAGECEIRVYSDGKTIISDSKGRASIVKVEDKYPNYERVIPDVHIDGYFKVKDPKAVISFIKSFDTDAAILNVNVESATVTITNTYKYGGVTSKVERTFELDATSSQDMLLKLDTAQFTTFASSIGWNGGVWAKPNLYLALYDSPTFPVALTTTLTIDGYTYPPFDKDETKMASGWERHKLLPKQADATPTAPTEKPNAKTAKAKVEQKQAPVIPMIPKATNATETQKVQVAANDTARTRERPKAYYSF